MNLKLKDNPNFSFSITQLEYIESTGTQWIETGVSFNSNIDYSIEVKAKYNSSIQYYLYNFNSYRSGAIMWSNDHLYVYNNISSKEIVVTGNRENLTISNIGSEIKVKSDTNTQTYSFDRSDNPQGTLKIGKDSNCIIKRVILYRNSELIKDFIPAKDRNGVVCMYEAVSKSFFYNQGSGDFVAGPIIGKISGPIPSNVALKITTIYNKNCPNIDSLYTLKSIQSVQSSLPAAQQLNRVRVDIDNVSGSISELMKFSTLNGFNDAYEPQAKPRLVGTWTINDWYTTAQFAEAQAAFDGLTIVGDPNYLIDFSQLAVQTLDSNQPNYNPAAAIILHGQNLGTTLNGPVVTGGGRWFLRKTQAAAITDISNWFYNKNTISDTNNIVTNTTQSYNFESFIELKYFTGLTYIGTDNNNSGFCSCSKLHSIELPNNITLKQAFYGCSSLKNVIFPQTFYMTDGAFYSSGIESIDLTNLSQTNIPRVCFAFCSALKNIIIPETIQSIGDSAFRYAGSGATFTQDDTFELYLPNLTSISNLAFERASLLTSIRSLGSITNIPEECFYSTYRLKSCVLPNTVKRINARAFNGSSIETINLDNGLEEILDYAFNETRNLKITSLPQSITKIGPGSFRYSGVNNITASDKIDVQLPNIGSTSSSYQLFENCKIIRNVIDLGSITTLGDECFENSGAILITVPSTVTSIGNQRGLPSSCIIHLLPTTPPTVGSNNNYITPTTVKLYVGDGSSAANDNAVLQAYLADTNWATYSSRLDTWYNYLHPQS